MTATTLLLLILSVLVAGGLAYLQYFFKAKSTSKWSLLLAFLRFLSILGILILLINPLVKIKKYEIEKFDLFPFDAFCAFRSNKKRYHQSILFGRTI